jgi:hypothetical protein
MGTFSSPSQQLQGNGVNLQELERLLNIMVRSIKERLSKRKKDTE